MRSYWVYILASKPRGTLYIGVTNGIIRRVEQHRAGKASSFTQKYKVRSLVWFALDGLSHVAEFLEEDHERLVARLEGQFDRAREPSLGGPLPLAARCTPSIDHGSKSMVGSRRRAPG